MSVFCVVWYGGVKNTVPRWVLYLIASDVIESRRASCVDCSEVEGLLLCALGGDYLAGGGLFGGGVGVARFIEITLGIPYGWNVIVCDVV